MNKEDKMIHEYIIRIMEMHMEDAEEYDKLLKKYPVVVPEEDLEYVWEIKGKNYKII